MLVETLQRVGCLDPARFYDLPPEWQLLHLAHTRNLFIGRYDPPDRKRSGKIYPADPADMERWRNRDRSRAVDAARRLLARPNLPAHLRQSAEATLRAAGAL